MKNKKMLVLIIFLGIGILFSFLLFFIFSSSSKNIDFKKGGEIKIKNEKGELTVNRNGKVFYSDANGNSYSDYWDIQKTSAFFGYFEKNYSKGNVNNNCSNNCIFFEGGVTSYSYDYFDDELYDAVIDDVLSGDDDNQEGDSIDDYYESGGDNNEQGTDDSNNNGSDLNQGGSGIDPECEYWIISYCVRKRTPSPTPSSTPIVTTIYEPNCFDSGNKQTGRTVISNELCVPEE